MSEQDDSAINQPKSGIERPEGCVGCGLQSAVDPDNPAPHETAFEEWGDDEEGVTFECGTCSTLTHVPRDPEPMVECRNCGDDIPESLQGNHVCKTHPLGKAADGSFDNPMEGNR